MDQPTTSCKWVRPQDLNGVWPLIEDYLQDALDKSLGEQNLNDVYHKILEKKYTLYVILRGKTLESGIDGVCVVSLDHTRKLIFNIVLLGGKNFDDWSHYLSVLEEEGKRLSVDYITLYGRKGWERKLKPLGFEQKYIVMAKRLR